MEWIAEILEKYNYWTFIIIMLIGLYGMIAKDNLIKKIIGLSIFQTAIFLFYVSLADVIGGTEPIVIEGYKGLYVNPLPHVLILTAIVVSVATLAVALALVIRIHEEYGTIEEREILIKEREAAS
ncbi:MAG: NADH-ubiquinone/plastoquinone oxidoreductase chain 4L [Candidatus Argoarchaeum ethanivorans]|uniref:NADH-ubiquinone/plastoquinone oxidoreductase chain 4L n=1 Tax=Candidatus Argoarchaeum ethanivorans TaxID=2608793 RepID=A0A811TIF8_9EURY|nr:MAG: NADH-ubiquinone/plastoquinone oxidoreductase chain 4L [Candidatus Argoarchaeum ethanivorans]CAD6494595.1 MAG: NADH-ubiquinone/plastoquinone oxidoreductase chain 4L [Candidatus Argoarchaeum ethanivorans]